MAALPGYYWGYVAVAENAVALGRLDEARAALAEARHVEPKLSLEMIQRSLGVSRPELDARRNAALRQAGLEWPTSPVAVSSPSCSRTWSATAHSRRSEALLDELAP